VRTENEVELRHHTVSRSAEWFNRYGKKQALGASARRIAYRLLSILIRFGGISSRNMGSIKIRGKLQKTNDRGCFKPKHFWNVAHSPKPIERGQGRMALRRGK